MAAILSSIRSLLLACLYVRISSSQQVGSFFTAIYINGNLASTQVSCSGLGQPNYCCGSGQYCAWDGSGSMACCPVGLTCQGRASAALQYTQTTSVYQLPQTTTAYLQQTTTVYSQQYTTTTQGVYTSDCKCEATTVVPVVAPYTVVTQQQSTVSTTYSPVTTYTPVPVTNPTSTVLQANCAVGFSTITMAGVGAPTLQSGCLLIVNSGNRACVFQHGTLAFSYLSVTVFLLICLYT